MTFNPTYIFITKYCKSYNIQCMLYLYRFRTELSYSSGKLKSIFIKKKIKDTMVKKHIF